MPTYHCLLSVILLLFICGCKDEPASPPLPQAGEQTLTVTAVAHDDFGRNVPLTGPVSILLVGDDRSVHASIPDGRSSFEFRGLPLKRFLLTAEKEGYYPFTTAAGFEAGGYTNWSPTVYLYPHPSPLMRIDSIAIDSTSSWYYYTFRLFMAQRAPSTYFRRVALFFGRSPSIDPSAVTTYEHDENVAGWGGGDVIDCSIDKNGLYTMKGARVYFTARLMTPATEVFMLDSSRFHNRYTNLETNTTVVSSFTPR